jgi:ribose transport system permease protein
MATLVSERNLAGFSPDRASCRLRVFMIGFIWPTRVSSPDNIMGVVRSSAILGVMALGVTFVVISGNLDLSVGSMMSFSTIVVLDLHDKIGPALAIPAMFAMTLALGAFIGFLVGYLRLNSLIVTSACCRPSTG